MSRLRLDVQIPSAKTSRDEALEIWFMGSEHPVTVSGSGWFRSTRGLVPRGDTYPVYDSDDERARGHTHILDVSYHNWTTGRRFDAKSVLVPLPTEDTLILCVDVVSEEFENKEESETKGLVVYRRKAFATFALESGVAPVRGLWDVPLLLRPIELVPSDGGELSFRDTRNHPWSERVVGRKWAENFSLVRGAAIVGSDWGTPLESPVDETRLYEAYVAYREGLERWTTEGVDWDWTGFAGSSVRRSRDLPTFLSTRTSVHVPACMFVDSAYPAFEATAEWWSRQVEMVLGRSHVTLEKFLTWRPSEQRTACMAARAAKAWAISRKYVYDYFTTTDGEFIVNESYANLQSNGNGDCDDYAISMYRTAVAMQRLSERDGDGSSMWRAVMLCREALSGYVACAATGFFQCPDYGDVNQEDLPPGERDEKSHAFCVLVPRETFEFWEYGSGEPSKRRPLIMDGVFWLDPCLGLDPSCAGCAHEDHAEARAAFFGHVIDACRGNLQWRRAIMVGFRETATRRSPRDMLVHDFIESLFCARPGHDGCYVHQFRSVDGGRGGAAFHQFVDAPEELRIQSEPGIPAESLELFRDALRYERPTPKMRCSPRKRAAFQRLLGAVVAPILGIGEPTGITPQVQVLVRLDKWVRRYPDVKVLDQAGLEEFLRRVVLDSARRANLEVVLVKHEVGSQVRVELGHATP